MNWKSNELLGAAQKLLDILEDTEDAALLAAGGATVPTLKTALTTKKTTYSTKEHDKIEAHQKAEDAQENTRKSDAFQDDRDALADADAHRAQRVAATALVQLVDRCRRQPRATGAQRMAQSNGAAVDVDASVVVLQTEQTQHCEALCRKGFVEFDHIHLIDREASERQHF